MMWTKTDLRNKRIVADYKSGLSYEEVAQRHGICRERVGQIIRSIAPGEIRSRQEAQALAWRDEQKREARLRGMRSATRSSTERAVKRSEPVLALKDRGLSMSEIGERLDLSRNAVAGLLRRARRREARAR